MLGCLRIRMFVDKPAAAPDQRQQPVLSVLRGETCHDVIPLNCLGGFSGQPTLDCQDDRSQCGFLVFLPT
jgi:hypothetical protein